MYSCGQQFACTHHGHESRGNLGLLMIDFSGMIVQNSSLMTKRILLVCSSLNLVWIFSLPHEVKCIYTTLKQYIEFMHPTNIFGNHQQASVIVCLIFLGKSLMLPCFIRCKSSFDVCLT